MHVRRQHRSARLLELQEQHVVGAAALEQGDVRPQADAADADDLVRDVDERVAAEHTPPVRRERLEIVIEAGSEPLAVLLGDVG